MIVWNDIVGVGDIAQPGQIIALVLGFGSLAQTLKDVYLDFRIALRIIGKNRLSSAHRLRMLLGILTIEKYLPQVRSKANVLTEKRVNELKDLELQANPPDQAESQDSSNTQVEEEEEAEISEAGTHPQYRW